jgi:PhnB protein
MKVDIYLNYGGNCREAFEFYAEHLGAKITSIVTHAQVPQGSANAGPEWSEKILHAGMVIGGAVVMAADIPSPPFEPMRSAYLSMSVESIGEAERVYALLSEGGQVFMKMEETFFAHRFAMLRDRFGTSWMILNEKPMH